MTLRPWKIVLGLTLSAQIVACTEKSYGPPEHKAPIETQGPQDLGELEDPTPASLGGMPSEDAFQDILDANQEENVQTAQVIMDKVVKPIAARVLTTRVLTDRELVSSGEYFRYLKLMQEGVLRVSKSDLNNADLAKFFETYDNLVLDPCSVHAACAELKFVSRDARYQMVLMYLTKVRKPGVVDSWRNLSYSLDFGLFPNSNEYSEWALATVTEYIKYLSQQPIEQVREELVRIKKVANQIVLSIQGRNDTVAKFFQRIDIWGEDTEGDLTRSVLREALWPVLIDGYAVVHGRPTASFAGYVDRQLSDFDDKVLGKFRTNPNWKLAFKNLNLSDMTQVDRTLLFVIDQAYENKMSVGDSLALLASLAPSNDSLITTAEQYIQIRFATQVIRTQDELKIHLGDPEKYRSIKQLQEQLAKAAPMEVEWAKFTERASSIKSLIETKAAQGNTITPEQNDRLNSIFNKMDRNIKWFAIYPNMLPVIYYMSKANLSDTIQILWFKFQLNSDLIFKFLFDGNLGGWFNFNNAVSDYSFFTTPEILLSFRNALLSGLFDSYQIPVSDFLNESTTRLTAKMNAVMELQSQALYDKLLVDYEGKSERSLFTRTIKYCNGDKRSEEVIDYKDLTRYLQPYASELDGGVRGASSSKANIHEIRLASKDMYDDGIYNQVDFYRTDDMYYLDMLDKMIKIYESYLQENGKSDPGLVEVKGKLEKLHRRMSYLYGIFFQITRNYYSCQDKLRTSFKSRMLLVYQYEHIYAARAYADLLKVAKNPALLDEVNATYRKTVPEVGENIQTFDHIVNKGGQFVFIFNKADFMLRLREYMLFGVKDANGTQLPAISPNMRIQIPKSMLDVTNGYGDYKFFYNRDEVATVEYREGITYDDFAKDYMTGAFYQTGGGYSEQISVVHATNRPWVTWSEIMTRSVPYTKIRMLMLSSLFKLGKFKIYDFDKKGCRYEMQPEDLEKEGCAVETKFTADEIYKSQMDILNFVNITPDYEKMMGYTQIPMIMGRGNLENSFFAKPSNQLIGILDGYRFTIGKEGLGAGVIFPNEMVDDRGYLPPHTGYISRALDYYRGIAVNGSPLLRPKPELDGQLKEMYQTYVDREWQPLQELEELAVREEKAGRGTYSLYLMRTYEPFKLPLLTPFSTPLHFLQLDLNRKTEFMFSHDAQEEQ